MIGSMFRPTTLSIRSLLLLITLVVALPAAGIIFYSGIRFRQAMLDDASKETLKLADRIVTEQENLVLGAEQLMTALTQLPEVKNRDAARVEPILRELRKLNPMYSNIFIADREGTVWATAVPVPPPFVVGDRRYFRNALASGRLSSGEFVVSRATTKPALNFAHPVKDHHGTIVGVISVGFVIDRYRQLLEQMQLPAGTSFVLSDHRGVVLSRAIDPERYIGTPYPAGEFRKMQQGPDSGTGTRVGIAGDRRIISYRKLRLAGEQTPYMYVTAGIPFEVAVRGADRALRNNVLLFTTFLLMAWAGAALIGKRSIVDRLRLLEDASRRVAEGDLQTRVSDLVVGGELGSLGQRFDAMAAELSRREVDRLKAEEERDRLVSILETTTDVVSMASPEGKIIYFNRAGRALTGIEDPLAAGVRIQEIHPEWAAERIMNAGIPTAIREGVWEGEAALLDARGREIPVSQVILGHRDAQGNLSHLSTVMRDISERKEAGRILEHNRNLLNETQKLVHLGSWELDLVSNVLVWSDEIYRIFEMDPGKFEVTYEAFLQAVHPEDRDLVNERFRKSVEERTPYEIVHRLLMSDGRIKIVLERGKTEYRDGTPVRSIGSVQDITDRHHAEEERLQLEAQLYQSQKIESIGRLAGGVAHDINNTLSAIMAHTELLKMKLPPEDPLRVHTEEMERASLRTRDIIRQLLAFSRKQVIEPVVLDLNQRIDETRRTMLPLIGEHIELAFLAWPASLRIKIDPSQLDQILVNLVVNARDAMTTGGRITIETKRARLDGAALAKHRDINPGEFVLLGVSDSGAGMSQEVLARIFEPFFTTKEEGRGTGLGLSTVFGIVQQNGGFIEVASEPGQGTSFQIFFPSAEASCLPESAAALPRHSAAGGTILLVEDDAIVREAMPQLLKVLGYRALVAASPEEALEISRDLGTRIDLLLTDVVMPGMSGKELREELNRVRPGIKVLFMSGYTAEVIALQGILQEGVQFIQKPFTLSDLGRKIEAVLGSPLQPR
jgi:PAS domain S-box-containing protein